MSDDYRDKGETLLDGVKKHSFLDDIGSGFLKIEAGKKYIACLWDEPILEPSPFKDPRTGLAKPDRRTYSLEVDGSIVKYSPGSTWERQLKAAMIAEKVFDLPIEMEFQKQGDGNLTNWNFKIRSLVE